MSKSESPAYGFSSLLRTVFDMQQGTIGSHMHRLLKAARLHLGMEVAFVSEFSGGRRYFRYIEQAAGVQVVHEGGSDPLDETYCQKVVDGRLPELIHNAQENEEACVLSATRALGIGAHLSVPVRLQDGSVFGTICCFSFHANPELNQRDLELMRIFSEIAGELIEKDIQRVQNEEASRNRILAMLESDGMHMVWQPIVEAGSRIIVGVEALARFSSEVHQGPDAWFREAAQAGLSSELESHAVALGFEVLDQLRPDQYVTCNASANAVLSGAVLDKLRHVPLSRVVLELTEHDVIEDYQVLEKVLSPLRKKGLRLAVDDAGAGYASLKHILYLRPDIIKLDMSLVRHVDTDIVKQSLVNCFIKFTQSIEAQVIAEGVETSEELDALNVIGVSLVQGFLLHRPMDADALLKIQ